MQLEALKVGYSYLAGTILCFLLSNFWLPRVIVRFHWPETPLLVSLYVVSVLCFFIGLFFMVRNNLPTNEKGTHFMIYLIIGVLLVTLFSFRVVLAYTL